MHTSVGALRVMWREGAGRNVYLHEIIRLTEAGTQNLSGGGGGNLRFWCCVLFVPVCDTDGTHRQRNAAA